MINRAVLSGETPNMVAIQGCEPSVGCGCRAPVVQGECRSSEDGATTMCCKAVATRLPTGPWCDSPWIVTGLQETPAIQVDLQGNYERTEVDYLRSTTNAYR